MFFLVSGTAITSPPSTTLALSDYPQIAGTASSLLGAARFAFGGIAAPLVGVAGALSILPLGLVTTASMVLAAIAGIIFLTRRTTVTVATTSPTLTMEGTPLCAE